MFKWLAHLIGSQIIRFLETKSPYYEPFSITDPMKLRDCLRPADVLLVEGNQRISAIIKYMTQSTWSHAAIFVGDALGRTTEDGEPLELVEALADEGVVAAPLSKYGRFNTRICRPATLTEADRRRVVDYAVASLGRVYDTRNVIDLMRYLIPFPPVPVRWRRRMLALGSGDPTRAICSTLIAQAFEDVRFPILPHIEKHSERTQAGDYLEAEIYHIRHHSLYTPRDFDVSPYFAVVKPTLETGFDYKAFRWTDRPQSPAAISELTRQWARSGSA